ncbi:hypothetical protein SAMN05444000_105145 [Shimia gijangensis]|uniref:DUF2059 domain-containing protein n=1 Tax=Shimia gijangensis TaxID=1470563 RepID=A0A1M6GW88_9RHOB|nr:DUF2059 domain-containing protein [Shimia gijangensis]SHJ14196.1 hypothetical protein SAMN05444000_105145 [Shimia gijangensis]
MSYFRKPKAAWLIPTLTWMLLGLAQPANADKESDIRFIVEHTITVEHFNEIYQSDMRTIMFEVVRRLRTFGIDIAEPEPFFDLLFEAFVVEFIALMQDEIAAYYHKTYTASEMRDLARFYSSPTGKKVFANTSKFLLANAAAIRSTRETAAKKSTARLAKNLEERGISLESSQGLTKMIIDVFD